MLLEGIDGAELSGSLLDLCLATAEGKMSKGELGGYTDIAIFKDGVTL